MLGYGGLLAALCNVSWLLCVEFHFVCLFCLQPPPHSCHSSLLSIWNSPLLHISICHVLETTYSVSHACFWANLYNPNVYFVLIHWKLRFREPSTNDHIADRSNPYFLRVLYFILWLKSILPKSSLHYTVIASWIVSKAGVQMESVLCGEMREAFFILAVGLISTTTNIWRVWARDTILFAVHALSWANNVPMFYMVLEYPTFV